MTERMAQFEYFQNIIKAMLGVDTPGQLGMETFAAIPWAHPVVLALIWAHAVIGATRVPAGEVDRGTIDLLLGLPVSRFQLFVSETVAWLISALLLLAACAAGHMLGRAQLPPGARVPISRLLEVLPHLFTLYLAVGAMAWLISSLSDRRGKAMSIAFLLVLASFLLNYLAQFWEPAKNVVFLSVLDYYRPYLVLRDGTMQWRDMAVLTTTGAILWTAAAVVFNRRDLHTL